MERTSKRSLNALFLVGLIFSVLGGMFAVLGVVFLIALPDTLGLMMGSIFGGIGSLFLVLGIISLINEGKRKRQVKKLLEGGRYIWGEIIDLVPNRKIEINGRHPYMAVVRYADGWGQSHLFRSESLRIYLDRTLIGKQVKIYITDDTFREYYIDLEPVLEKYIEH